MIRLIITIFIFSQLLFSNEAFDIVKKLDENMRGENISMKLSIRVVSLGHERTMKMQTYSQGTKKALQKFFILQKIGV